MKRLFIFFLFLLSEGCNSGSPLPFAMGVFDAKVNGSQWSKTYKNAYQGISARWSRAANSSAVPCSVRYVSVNSRLFNSEGALRQELIFIKLPLSIGRHQVSPFKLKHCDDNEPVYAVLHTYISDGDVTGDRYNVLASADNYLKIEAYNASTEEIAASFQMTLVLEEAGYGHHLPDTLHFTEGRFHTKIFP